MKGLATLLAAFALAAPAAASAAQPHDSATGSFKGENPLLSFRVHASFTVHQPAGQTGFAPFATRGEANVKLEQGGVRTHHRGDAVCANFVAGRAFVLYRLRQPLPGSPPIRHFGIVAQDGGPPSRDADQVFFGFNGFGPGASPEENGLCAAGGLPVQRAHGNVVVRDN